jgi:hypothetical protein
MDELNLNLQEVDSLEAIVIVDNELDPMSPPAPDTVQIMGNLGQIAMKADNNVTDRGGASKELRMEDICCSAHGLSILVVRLCNSPTPAARGIIKLTQDRQLQRVTRNTRFFSMLVRRKMSGREMSTGSVPISPPSKLSNSRIGIEITPVGSGSICWNMLLHGH